MYRASLFSVVHIFSNPAHILSDKMCLISSETWSGTGFYADVKLKKKDEILDVHCIMTNYHVFLQNIQYGEDMVAVFHHEGTEKEPFELPLVPFNLLAHSEVCTKYSPVACTSLQNFRGAG